MGCVVCAGAPRPAPPRSRLSDYDYGAAGASRTQGPPIESHADDTPDLETTSASMRVCPSFAASPGDATERTLLANPPTHVSEVTSTALRRRTSGCSATSALVEQYTVGSSRGSSLKRLLSPLPSAGQLKPRPGRQTGGREANVVSRSTSAAAAGPSGSPRTPAAPPSSRFSSSRRSSWSSRSDLEGDVSEVLESVDIGASCDVEPPPDFSRRRGGSVRPAPTQSAGSPLRPLYHRSPMRYPHPEAPSFEASLAANPRPPRPLRDPSDPDPFPLTVEAVTS